MNRDGVRGFDFHCHIDLFPDPAATIAACEAARIVTLAVTTTPKAWGQNRKWTAGKRYVHAALGLHPELVADRHGEIELLEQLIAETTFIGEIGLDGSLPHRVSLPIQRDILRRTIQQADRLGGRVLSIHSRRAAKDVVECLAANGSVDRVLPILHWFSDSAMVARHAVRAGCYFSINHRMLESTTGLALVRSIPVDRLLTETDAPFTMIRGRKSEPSDVLETVSKLAAALGVATDEIKSHLWANASRVIRFAGIDLERDDDG